MSLWQPINSQLRPTIKGDIFDDAAVPHSCVNKVCVKMPQSDSVQFNCSAAAESSHISLASLDQSHQIAYELANVSMTLIWEQLHHLVNFIFLNKRVNFALLLNIRDLIIFVHLFQNLTSY